MFFAKLADRELDRLWDEGVINEEVMEGWAHEHMSRLGSFPERPAHQRSGKRAEYHQWP